MYQAPCYGDNTLKSNIILEAHYVDDDSVEDEADCGSIYYFKKCHGSMPEGVIGNTLECEGQSKTISPKQGDYVKIYFRMWGSGIKTPRADF